MDVPIGGPAEIRGLDQGRWTTVTRPRTVALLTSVYLDRTEYVAHYQHARAYEGLDNERVDHNSHRDRTGGGVRRAPLLAFLYLDTPGTSLRQLPQPS